MAATSRACLLGPLRTAASSSSLAAVLAPSAAAAARSTAAGPRAAAAAAGPGPAEQEAGGEAGARTDAGGGPGGAGGAPAVDRDAIMEAALAEVVRERRRDGVSVAAHTRARGPAPPGLTRARTPLRKPAKAGARVERRVAPARRDGAVAVARGRGRHREGRGRARRVLRAPLQQRARGEAGRRGRARGPAGRRGEAGLRGVRAAQDDPSAHQDVARGDEGAGVPAEPPAHPQERRGARRRDLARVRVQCGGFQVVRPRPRACRRVRGGRGHGI